MPIVTTTIPINSQTIVAIPGKIAVPIAAPASPSSINQLSFVTLFDIYSNCSVKQIQHVA